MNSRISVLAAAAVILGLTGCATTGPTGGTRFNVPIQTASPFLGGRPIDARAVVVVPQEVRAYKDYAPIPMGAWDAQWGKNLPAAAESAFRQVFQTALLLDRPDDSADYEIQLRFDPTRTHYKMGFSQTDASLAVIVRLAAGRELLWERSFEAHVETSSNNESLAKVGGMLADALGQAAAAVSAEVLKRPEPAGEAPVRRNVAAAPAPRPVAHSDVDDAPAPRARRAGHAVIIGIEHYREHLPNADFAAGDARIVAEYVKNVLGYPEENVALLVDDRATRGDFEKYFESWLPNRVEKGDEVFVFFSGHGAPNPRTGDAYMVPFDADPTYIDQMGYSLKKLYAQLAKLPAKSVTVAMDSCFSGAGGRSVIAKGARPLVTIKTEELPAHMTVLSASAGDQISNSFETKGHGLFTYYFLKGLREKGPDMKAVFDYLRPEVSRTARRDYNTDQMPQWRQGE